MRIGIVPNTTKHEVVKIVNTLISKLEEFGFEYVLSKSLLKFEDDFDSSKMNCEFLPHAELCNQSDIVISIGGDGTMLTTAYEARNSNTPILGLNFGKLGFLAEFEMKNLDELLTDIKNKNYYIDERTTLEAVCRNVKSDKLFAVNDIVIDKGGWSKMIQLTLQVDDDYVTTFSADGIIIATPTGTTGYSLSAGGPIVSPSADAIVVNPISPHTLTMRPLVLSSKQKIIVTVDSPYKSVQINTDGQRVHYFSPPLTIEIRKSEIPLKLVHTDKMNYFETLRTKLFWGLDIRNNKF
jgi:NAD+ kinase